MNSKISTLVKHDTLYNADSVEWCPHNPGYFVCGTYQLIEENCDGESEQKSSDKNTRVGSIILLNYDHSLQCLKEVQKIQTAAITDIKWYDQVTDGKSIMGATESSGNISLYALSEEINGYNLERVTSLDVCPTKLLLSLDWAVKANLDTSADSHKVVVSDSGGSVSEAKFSNKGNVFEVTHQWKAHNFDAWITAYDRWNTSIVYSGGDDCTLKAWDTRTGCCKPIFTNKHHLMGVCSIQSSPHMENVFASGSYDEQICVWDNRTMRAPLATCEVGGGIWRIKWHPEEPTYMLAACCHSGFKVLRLDLGKSSEQCQVVGSYLGHKSLAYGADWAKGVLCSTSSKNSNCLNEVLATCSFYDHSLHLWEIEYQRQLDKHD